jgi:hypothetical protein
MPASRRETFHEKTNPGMVILLTFWGKLSPIFLKSFLSRLQNWLRKISVSRGIQSKKSSSRSFGYGDSPEGACYIRSQRLKRPIGQRWQMTRWAFSIAKWTIFSRIMTGNELWLLYWCLSDYMFAASRDKVIPREKPRRDPESYVDDFLQRYESDHLEYTDIRCTIQSRILHP